MYVKEWSVHSRAMYSKRLAYADISQVVSVYEDIIYQNLTVGSGFKVEV